MVADNESGRGKEGMVEPVHVFDVSHFMSFREGRGEEGRERGERGEGGEGEGRGEEERERGEERRGEEGRGGEGGRRGEHVNFSGGGQKLASQETSDYLYGS